MLKMSKKKEHNPDTFYQELLMKLNKCRVSHIFYDNIDRVYNLFKSIKHYKSMHKGYFEDIMCINGNENDFSSGSEYKSFWKDTENKFRVEDIVNTENFKEIHIHFYDIGDYDHRFRVMYKFYNNTTDDYTYWCYDIVFNSSQALSYYQQTFNDNDCIKLFKNFDKYLYTGTTNIEQVESIVLDIGFKDVWNTITDWKTFQKHVPIIADSVEYERSSDQRISLIKLVYKHDKSEYYLRVLRFVLDSYSGDYDLLLFSSNSKFASQEMRFKVISLVEKTLLVFKHVFSKFVKTKVLKDLSQNKKEILTTLKKSMH
jgi:hypothetical protein